MGTSSSVKGDPSRLWRQVGGDLSLEFTNTLSGRGFVGTPDQEVRGAVETLGSYADLLKWARFIGCSGPEQARRLEKRARAEPELALATLDRAVNLREAIYRIALRLMERTGPARVDLEVLNEELRIARAQQALKYREGALAESWLQADERLDGILWPIGVAAGRLFAAGPLQRLKACPGRACGWLFLDRTKNGTRRWCSMRDCGNPSKVRAFRLRLSARGTGQGS
jgi:predicted RNA-binding Zn ribbon-like protein